MRACFIAAAVALSIVFSPVLWAADVTPEQVDEAIRKAIEYLYSQEKGDNWEIVPRPDGKSDHADVKNWQWGGVTAVAACALLYAGENYQKPELKRAIDWMKKTPILGYYGLGFRCQVWAMLPRGDPAIRQMAMRERDYLLAGVYKGGEYTGFYPYYLDPQTGKGKPDNWGDHSVSQYGVLGMWALSQLNIEVPTQYWQMVEMGWKAHQHPSGSWSYRLKDNNKDWEKGNLAMTAAGLASLFITQEMIHPTDGLRCTGNIRDEHIERALKWVHENFRNFEQGRAYYALYGVERIGVASGYKYFGNLNWYQVGANYLVSHQHQDGSWGDSDDHWNPHKVADTAFGLMFLARGRAPVMMNKLEYIVDRRGDNARPPTWNERSRDVANIARWTGRQMERELNWQIVNLQAPVEEMHDAPILWISGKETLNFTDPEREKLRQFIEQGGMIVGNADCGSKNFGDSFKKVGTTLFPMYEFRELPQDHPIYTSQQFKRTSWHSAPFIQGLSNGARELMLLFPTVDPAAAWQTQSFAGGSRQPMAQAMANIFLYAVDKRDLRVKGQHYIVLPKPDAKISNTIRLARLQYNGNWDPEPGGWRRLANIMRNDREIDLQVETVKLGAGKLAGHDVAHMTGTAKFKLTDAQRDELRKFIEAGGTLIVDATGGAAEFRNAAEAELTAIFPTAGKMQTLKAEDAAFSAVPIKELEYRNFARSTGGLRGPRLKGMKVNGRLAIVFSDEDLSVGLVGQPVDGIRGYSPKTATEIMENLLLYAKK